jgi:hypothetical protein
MAAQQRSLRLAGVLGLPPIERASRATPAACLARGRAPSDSRDDKIVGPWTFKPHAHKRYQSVLDCRSHPREAR